MKHFLDLQQGTLYLVSLEWLQLEKDVRPRETLPYISAERTSTVLARPHVVLL